MLDNNMQEKSHPSLSRVLLLTPAVCCLQGGDVCRKFAPSSLLLNDAGWRVQHPGERTLDVIDPSSSSPLRPAVIEPPFDVKKINSNPLLDVKRLNEWDYPIFDLAVEAPKSVLSMVRYQNLV